MTRTRGSVCVEIKILRPFHAIDAAPRSMAWRCDGSSNAP